MINDAYVSNLKSHYGKETTNLVVPLSDQSWRFLAQLNEFVPLPLPKLIEAIIDTAISHGCWPEVIEWGYLMDRSPIIDELNEQIRAIGHSQ